METGLLNSFIKVRFMGEDDLLMLRHGKIYNARILKKGGTELLMKLMRNTHTRLIFL